MGAVLLWATLASGCGEAASELGRVSTVARPGEAEATTGAAGDAGRPSPSSAENIRRGGQGPESILEFGLFGPVVPTLESNGYYASDCRFENDPYETCL